MESAGSFTCGACLIRAAVEGKEFFLLSGKGIFSTVFKLHYIFNVCINITFSFFVCIRYDSDNAAVPVSALLGYGLDKLKQCVESTVMANTGRNIMTIKVHLESPQLRYVNPNGSIR